MAEPVIEMDTRAYNASVTGRASYTVPIIDAGVVQTGVLRWSTSGVSGNVELPASGNKWAEELWWDAASDTQIADSSDTPDEVSQPYAMFVIDTNVESFESAPKFTVFDGPLHTEVEEFCVGTTSHPTPFTKASISTTFDPSTHWTTERYWNEASSSAVHSLKVAGSQNANGNNGLCGNTNYLQASSVDLNTHPQYIWLALSLPDDASTGVDAIDGVLSILYTYT